MMGTTNLWCSCFLFGSRLGVLSSELDGTGCTFKVSAMYSSPYLCKVRTLWLLEFTLVDTSSQSLVEQ